MKSLSSDSQSVQRAPMLTKCFALRAHAFLLHRGEMERIREGLTQQNKTFAALGCIMSGAEEREVCVGERRSVFTKPQTLERRGAGGFCKHSPCFSRGASPSHPRIGLSGRPSGSWRRLIIKRRHRRQTTTRPQRRRWKLWPIW